jgi:hypothetical protein
MAKILHTPAPWTDDEAGFLGADGRPVGQPDRGVRDPAALLRDFERVRADRRLMALAPSLLEVVREFVGLDSWLRTEADYETHDDFAQWRAVAERARVVLAKAEEC